MLHVAATEEICCARPACSAPHAHLLEHALVQLLQEHRNQLACILQRAACALQAAVCQPGHVRGPQLSLQVRPDSCRPDLSQLLGAMCLDPGRTVGCVQSSAPRRQRLVKHAADPAWTAGTGFAHDQPLHALICTMATQIARRHVHTIMQRNRCQTVGSRQSGVWTEDFVPLWRWTLPAQNTGKARMGRFCGVGGTRSR